MRDTRSLGIEHLGSPTSDNRHQRYGKHDHSNTALPLRKAPPKQYPVRKSFDIGQYGRACRRKTRHRFEISIRHIIYIAT